MDESKRSRSDDRLSELPDSLIFEIFWLLPITDVIRTTKLSRRWRDLWTISPFLNFTDYDIGEYTVEGPLFKGGGIFNRALLLWRGHKLLKLKVIFSHELSGPLVGDVTVWLRFAKEKGVKELFLDLQYPDPIDDYPIVNLQTLFSCSSLEVLSIKEFCFLDRVNRNVKWDLLKRLAIHICCLGQEMLSKVLCGSPNLEEFILDYVVGGEGGNWCIQSTSLKKLCIENRSETEDYKGETEMKIQTPNLETLEISGVPYTKFSMDVAPLSDATLTLNCMEEPCNCGEIGNVEFHYIKGMLEQILPTIQHVERLTLRECCLEVLGAMNRKSLLSPFSDLKFLKLKLNSSLSRPESFSKHFQIAGLLQNFPNLKRLVIDDDYKYNSLLKDVNEDEYQDDRESCDFEANLPNTFLLQLRMVEVTWAKCYGSIFLFIKTLLKYASKLEKMVFRVREFQPPSSPSRSLDLASQKLLRMPRSSPNAQLIFCKY